MEGGGGGIKGWMERMNGGREEEKAQCRWWYENDELMERGIDRGIKKIILKLHRYSICRTY